MNRRFTPLFKIIKSLAIPLADHVGIKHTRIQMVERGKGPLAAETGESFRLNVRDVGRPGYEETRGKRGLKGRWWVAGTECNIW
ncbi:hypothetical protein HZH66_007861 [Vespula vulgaris]|uniref:Uncharacterized protein n=2 Tax=Vespula TaxID=7451 RepID=A0A834U8G5_VESPE|nr:hypothetical protein HZH66_007861 [Vespula vulgaris]KAF7421590.1 hypothetical protein H0235_009426 [Vespula pensylvanica]